MRDAPLKGWKGPGESPHIYTPDFQAMGDCRICGHVQVAHGADGGWLAMAEARFPIGAKVILKRPGEELGRKTVVNGAPHRLPNGSIVVGVRCTTAGANIDHLTEA